MSKAFGSRYSIENSEEAKEYFEFVKDLLDSDVVNEMKNFRQLSRLQKIGTKFKIRSKSRSASRSVSL